MNNHRHARTTFASRALLVERVQQQGWKLREAAEAFGISERTAGKWLRRFECEGLEGLKDRSSRPRRQPHKTPPSREAMVLALRELRFTAARIGLVLGLPKATVARILARHGQSRLPPLRPPEPVVRYEWKRPGDLIHLDTKKLGRIERIGHRIHGDRTTRVRGAGWEYVHVCIDDASRLAYVEVLADEKGTTVAAFLKRATAWYAERGVKVRRVMTDNGSGYVSKIFAGACRSLHQRHLRTRAYTPKTNGKAERLVQTLLREWAYVQPYPHSRIRTAALRPWLRYYNEHRPHGSLNSMPPITRIASAV
jgi:transposase InsO family protein